MPAYELARARLRSRVASRYAGRHRRPGLGLRLVARIALVIRPVARVAVMGALILALRVN